MSLKNRETTLYGELREDRDLIDVVTFAFIETIGDSTIQYFIKIQKSGEYYVSYQNDRFGGNTEIIDVNIDLPNAVKKTHSHVKEKYKSFIKNQSTHSEEIDDKLKEILEEHNET